ncbi:TPA: hypothetical protein ACRG29_005760, partial [Klebsiella pneumoniae]
SGLFCVGETLSDTVDLEESITFLNYVIMFFTSVILEAKACIACVEPLSAANFWAGRHCDKTGILIWYGYLNSPGSVLYTRAKRDI